MMVSVYWRNNILFKALFCLVSFIYFFFFNSDLKNNEQKSLAWSKCQGRDIAECGSLH